MTLSAFIVGLAWGFTQNPEEISVGSSNPSYGNCTISESLVTIGNATSSSIVSRDTTRQWAMLQQPVNATNTISVSFTGPAVANRGHQIVATSTLGLPEFRFGPTTELNTINAVTAIASAGTTTMKLLECKGKDF